LLVRFLGIAVLDITRKNFSAARPKHFAPKDTHGGILFAANCFRARNSNNAANIWPCGCAGAQMHRKAHPIHDPDTQRARGKSRQSHLHQRGGVFTNGTEGSAVATAKESGATTRKKGKNGTGKKEHPHRHSLTHAVKSTPTYKKKGRSTPKHEFYPAPKGTPTYKKVGRSTN
jgi:hypothetical protein